MATVTARDLKVTFGSTVVLDGVSLTATPGDRLGIIGPNGTGKTTLLRALAGLARIESGSVRTTPPDATVGYLTQVPERSTTETVRSALGRRTGVAAAHDELHAATAAIAESEAGADDRYAGALDRWLSLGGADLDSRIGEVWNDLGLVVRLLDQPTASLSGGEAARAHLAAILLSRYDVLLLDEPTNDLDFGALARLEAFVVAHDAPLLLVSHDRVFLQRTITGVIELDAHTRTAARFDGGWDAYLEERAVAARHAAEAYEEYAGTRDQLQSRIQRQKQWTQVGVANAKKKATDNDKNIKAFKKATSEKQAGKIRQSEKAMARLDAVEKPWEAWDLRLEIAAAPRSGAVVARLDGAVVQRGEFRLGPVVLEIGWADRVAIVGPNGSGKSTLLAALLGRIPLAEGTAYLGPGVVVGEIDQGRWLLDGDRPLIDAFTAASGWDAVPGGATDARTLLAKFGLGASHVGRPASSLSPGERTRATLAVLQARGVNCLVLDEPTNHLDLPAIEQLEQAVDSFEGTVLLVTHDRQLLEAVTTTRTLQVDGGIVSSVIDGRPRVVRGTLIALAAVPLMLLGAWAWPSLDTEDLGLDLLMAAAGASLVVAAVACIGVGSLRVLSGLALGRPPATATISGHRRLRIRRPTETDGASDARYYLRIDRDSRRSAGVRVEPDVALRYRLPTTVELWKLGPAASFRPDGGDVVHLGSPCLPFPRETEPL